MPSNGERPLSTRSRGVLNGSNALNASRSRDKFASSKVVVRQSSPRGSTAPLSARLRSGTPVAKLIILNGRVLKPKAEL